MSFKFTLQRMRINRDGYDQFDRYWGTGTPLSEMPLYWYCEDDKTITTKIRRSELTQGFIRAVDRDHAKKIVRDKYPGARFY